MYFQREGKGGGDRERNINVREKHQHEGETPVSCLLFMPQPRNPQPRYVPLSGIEPANLCTAGQCPTN